MAPMHSTYQYVGSSPIPTELIRRNELPLCSECAGSQRAPFRRLEISFSQGAEWKALINTYIQTIPFSGDASCAGEQSMSAPPLSRTPVSNAMTTNVGAAASKSQPAASSAATLLAPPLARTVSPRVAIIAPPARNCRGDATRRPVHCVPSGRGRATGTCPRARPVRGHRSNRYDRRRRLRGRKH